MKDESSLVVIFDGVCNLCNGLVDFVIRRDPRVRVRFAARQSPAGKRLLEAVAAADTAEQSVVVVAAPRVYLRSRGVLEIARRLRFPWPLCFGLIVIPAVVRDAVYNMVARRRVRWFGQRDRCRMPTAIERAHFLDEAPGSTIEPADVVQDAFPGESAP
jgi:predicted DCC family thiol-disulfide oxidoreductase YuxK